jgi:hypothetical protein
VPTSPSLDMDHPLLAKGDEAGTVSALVLAKWKRRRNRCLYSSPPIETAAQARRKLAEAKAACQEALGLHPGSTIAKQRLQRIPSEFALPTQAQAVTTFEEALRRGAEQRAPL